MAAIDINVQLKMTLPVGLKMAADTVVNCEACQAIGLAESSRHEHILTSIGHQDSEYPGTKTGKCKYTTFHGAVLPVYDWRASNQI
ncbi:uncharacterized protein V6R79_006351 [Siganus canaliculatus]